jgi:hypothetical protein
MPVGIAIAVSAQLSVAIPDNGAVVDNLLLEDGDDLLLEDGSLILLQ